MHTANEKHLEFKFESFNVFLTSQVWIRSLFYSFFQEASHSFSFLLLTHVMSQIVLSSEKNNSLHCFTCTTFPLCAPNDWMKTAKAIYKLGLNVSLNFPECNKLIHIPKLTFESIWLLERRWRSDQILSCITVFGRNCYFDLNKVVLTAWFSKRTQPKSPLYSCSWRQHRRTTPVWLRSYTN